MAEDIAPGLLEEIRKSFAKNLKDDKELQRLHTKIESGKADYKDAAHYANRCGSALAKAFGKHFTGENMPQGKAYYNIASRVLEPMLLENFGMISDAACKVQEDLNRIAGLNIKVQKPPVNRDRIAGIINRVSDAEELEDVEWILQEPVRNFSMNVVDDVLKANVDFQGKAGLRPVVVRESTGKCCKWCDNLAGVYEYPRVPSDVYRRHERCNCSVTYNPGDGRRQNVWSKRWE